MIFTLPIISEQEFNQMLNSNNYSKLNLSNNKMNILNHTILQKQIYRQTKNKNVKVRYNLHNFYQTKYKNIFNNKKYNNKINIINKKDIAKNKLSKFIKEKEEFKDKKPTKNSVYLHEIIEIIEQKESKFNSELIKSVINEYNIILFMYNVFRKCLLSILKNINSFINFFISY